MVPDPIMPCSLPPLVELLEFWTFGILDNKVFPTLLRGNKNNILFK